MLADCLEHTETVRQLYELAVDALENERQVSPLWGRSSPDSIVYRSARVLALQVEVLRRFRQVAEQQAGNFRSEGFRRLFAMLRQELSEDYLRTVGHHLSDLEFKHGMPLGTFREELVIETDHPDQHRYQLVLAGVASGPHRDAPSGRTPEHHFCAAAQFLIGDSG